MQQLAFNSPATSGWQISLSVKLMLLRRRVFFETFPQFNDILLPNKYYLFLKRVIVIHSFDSFTLHYWVEFTSLCLFLFE